MITSMTGFGSGRREAPGLTLAVEIKTVNHRHLDLHVRMPSEFQGLEAVVRKALAARLKRGRVDVFIRIELTRNSVRLEANPALIASYVKLVEELRAQFPISGDLTLEGISKLPGAITVSNQDLGPDELTALSGHLVEATEAALEQVQDMRAREGVSLARDLSGRIDAIRSCLETITRGAAGLLDHHRELLLKRVAELAPKLEVDSNRLEVEALMYAEKSDIAEEITRLGSHLDQFARLGESDGEAGKRMDFLLQEMNREVTTILSKTSGLNHSGAAIGQAGIDIKVEIDKLREQVQNVE